MIVIHVTAGFGGGVGTVVKNLVKYQIQNNYKVGVVYSYNKNEDKDYLYKSFSDEVLLLPQKRKGYKGELTIRGLPIKQVYNEIKIKYPSEKVIFHVHSLATLGLLNNIDDMPIICTIHGINYNGSYISRLLTRLILKKAINKGVKLVGVSNQTSEYYNNIIKRNKVTTIKNGVDINPTKSNYNFNEFTIGFVAYLDDLKGWKYLFDAYNLLDSNYKNQINLVFAGSGNKEDILRLQNLIISNNLTQNVQYLGEVYSAGNTLIPNLNLVVLPSLSEGIPMTLLEAIGNGVPILATNVGGVGEVLQDGINGFFIKRDPLIIANHIKRIYDDRELYNKLSCNCIKIYNEIFTLENMGYKYSELYNLLLEEQE